MKKRFFRVSLVVLLVAWLSWALSPLWKPEVYGYAPEVLVNFIGYDRDLSGSAGKVEFVPSAFELSDDCEIGFSFKPSWAEEVNTNFSFDMPRYGNEYEVRMLIKPDTGIVGAIAWDEKREADLKPDAPDGTQPYLLLGVILQLKEDAIAEGRKRIPAGLQL